MERDDKQSLCNDPLLMCCLCKGLLRNPMQLLCLHSCCRQCLTDATDADNSSEVKCTSCNRVTQACDAEPNTFLEYLVRGNAGVNETNTCAICKENGDTHVLAIVWCGSCKQPLCGDCIPAHNRYNRNHCIQSLDKLKSLEESRLKTPSLPPCFLHKRPMEFVCFTCEKAKCLNCWAACNKNHHAASLMSDDSFEVCLQNLISTLSSSEDKILKKCHVFQLCKNVLSELKSARVAHLESIQQRKQRIMDTVENVYQEIELATLNMYDSVEREAENVAAIAASLDESISFSRDYVHRLVGSNSNCDLWNQQKTLRNHLNSLSSELDKLKTLMDEPKSVFIESSLPENLDYVLKSWIGEPRVDAACASSLTQSQLFRKPSGSSEPTQSRGRRGNSYGRFHVDTLSYRQSTSRENLIYSDSCPSDAKPNYRSLGKRGIDKRRFYKM